ncbi:MAG: glycogen synthase [Ignavibacteriales bacterium]|nr:glycogen synthase [Ignavibacteriales bacterium]
MNIAFVTSEVIPFSKTGGLADVSGALPLELSKKKHNVKIFTPKYYSIDASVRKLEYLHNINPLKIRILNKIYDVHVFKGFLPTSKVEVYFFDCPWFFHRNKFYTNDPDEDERFIILSKAVIETIQRLYWSADIIHCNDWQTGLLPLMIKSNYNWDRLFDKTATLFTIHNIAYQGKFPLDTINKTEVLGRLNLPLDKVEHENMFNFMKTGISFADVINTVSETYAKEILTPEYGEGMEAVLRYRKNDLYGILNGVDYKIWNPKIDKLIPFNYSKENLEGKENNKKHLLKTFNIGYKKNVPLLGIVSRLAIQKGFDLIQQIMPDLMNLDLYFVVLGTGEYEYEEMFNYYVRTFPNKVGVYIGYNNELAHLIEAGSDIFLMPSKYEPCGLNQIYSLKYGTVPVVRKTGGLADTVNDWNEFNGYGLDIGNGFSFVDYSSYALISSIKRSIGDYYNKPIWEKIQLNGMNRDYSWENSAKKYIEIYKKAQLKRK